MVRTEEETIFTSSLSKYIVLSCASYCVYKVNKRDMVPVLVDYTFKWGREKYRQVSGGNDISAETQRSKALIQRVGARGF